MGDIIRIPRRDQWQFSLDVVRKADGEVAAVLTDARASLIEGQVSPSESLRAFAFMLDQGAEALRRLARDIEQPEEKSRG